MKKLTKEQRLIKALIRGVEKKTGEKVISVSGHLNMGKCPYCGRTEPCQGSYPEGCFHPIAYGKK